MKEKTTYVFTLQSKPNSIQKSVTLTTPVVYQQINLFTMLELLVKSD